MAGLTLPIIATDFGTIAKNEQAIGKLNTTIAKSTDTQAKAVERATQALDAYSRKADQVGRKRQSLIDTTPAGQLAPKLGPIEESIARMDTMLKGLANSISGVFSKQEREMTSLAAAMTKDTVTREKQISAMRLGEAAKYADVRAIEKQEMALIKAEAALRAYNQATHKSTIEAQLAKEAKEAPIKAMASRQRAGTDARQRAYDLTLPEVQETEQLKVLNSATLQAITLTQRLTGEKIKQEEASKDVNKQLAASNEILKIQNKMRLEARTADAREAASLQKLAEQTRWLGSTRRQELEVDKLAAQGAMQEATAKQRNINMLAEETRRLQASMDSKNLDLHYLREKARLRNELAAAEAKAAARTDPDTRGAGARLAVLREQAHLENQLAVAQARKSGVLRPLVAQLEQYRKQTDAAGVSTKTFSLRVHLAAQGAAAMRSAMYGMGASFGIFTSATLLVASSVYAVTAAFRSAIQSALEYEKALAALGAYSSRAQHGTQQYTDDLLELDAAVKQAAISSKYTTLETTEAMKQLALAGLTATETIGAVPSTLRLASIGALDFAKAADIATNIMMGFRLQVKDLPRVVDVLSKAATESNTDVEQLGTAMSYAAPLAESFGVSLEYTTAAMEVLANSGIKASRAGTGMRRVFLSLFTPTEKIRSEIEKFGVTLGKFGDVEGLAEIEKLPEVFDKVADGSAEAQRMLEEFYVATVGGTKNLQLIRNAVGVYATPAMIQLVKSVGMGKKSVQELAEELKKAYGSSEDQSKKMLDNLKDVGNMMRAAGSVIAGNLFDKAEEDVRKFADSLLSTLRALAANKKAIDALYESVMAIGKAVLTVVSALVAYKAILISGHVVMWAWSKAASIYTMIGTAAAWATTRVKALTVAQAALATTSTANLGLGMAGAAGGAATAGGLMAGIGSKLPVVGTLAVLAAGLYALYEQYSGIPDAIDKTNKAVDAFSEASENASEQVKTLFQSNVFEGGLAKMYAELASIQKELAATNVNNTEQINALGRSYRNLAEAIGAAEAALVEYAKVNLGRQLIAEGKALEDSKAKLIEKQTELSKATALVKEMNQYEQGQDRPVLTKYAGASQRLADLEREVELSQGLVQTLTLRRDITASFQGALLIDDEAKRTEELKWLHIELTEQLKQQEELLKNMDPARGGLFDQDMLSNVQVRLTDLRTTLSAINQLVDAQAEKEPAAFDTIMRVRGKALDENEKRMRLLRGTELQQKRAALDMANEELASAKKQLDIKRGLDASALSAAASNQTDAAARAALTRRQEEFLAATVGVTDATEKQLAAQKAYDSELDSAANAYNKTTKSAADLHEAHLALTKDLADLKSGFTDLTEDTLTRGIDFYNQLTAGAARYATTLRVVKHSGTQLPGVGPVEGGVLPGGPASGRYSELYNKYGQQYGVSPALLSAMGKQESGYAQGAVSPKGAVGVMQLMPATAVRFGVTDRTDPAQSIEGAAKYMKFLLDKFGGDVQLALAGYNAGEGAVVKHGGVPPYAETQEYVSRITGSQAQRNLAIIDEAKSVYELQSIGEATEATVKLFNIRNHLNTLAKEQEQSEALLVKRYGEVQYWQNLVNTTSAADTPAALEAAKNAQESYRAELDRANKLRENQIKWDEEGIRNHGLTAFSVKRTKEELELLSEKYIDGKTAIKDYSVVKAELNLLVQEGKLTQDEYTLALSRAIKTVMQAQGKYSAFFATLKYDSEDFAKIGVQAFTDLRDAMAEAFAGGKWNFEKMLTGMRDAAAKFAADQVILGLFAPKDEKTGKGGLLSGLTSLGSLFGGGGGGVGGVDASPFDIAYGPKLANGGAISSALPHGIYTGPTLFPMASPGMHAFANGVGLLGEAGPEAVLPLTQMPGGRMGVEGTAPVVNITVKTLPGQTAKTSQSSNGNIEIEILESRLASRVLNGGTPLSRSLETAYGIKRS